jgi:hypothetical protein
MESLRFADALDLEMVKVTIGIRIYPDTELAHHARQVGKIAFDDDLLFPRFYIENALEPWIREMVDAWLEDRPHWFY